VRVVALGDAHLGRSYLPYTTAEGVNQRERDFEISFEAAVELALQQEPEVVMAHSALMKLLRSKV